MKMQALSVALLLGVASAAAAEDVVLTNYGATCDVPQLVSALPNEAGEWASTTITPDAYPFTPTRIRYRLAPGHSPATSGCNVSMAHRVRLYVSDTVTPAADPDVVAEIDVPAGINYPGYPRIIELDLYPNISVDEGEHLIVAIEMQYEDGLKMCLVTCEAGTENTDFWSNAVSPLYSWVELSNYQVYGNLDVEVGGDYGAPPPIWYPW